MAAGLLAGLLAGLFGFLVGESSLDRAIALEEASSGAHHEEVFSRSTQKVGLFFATGLFGVTVGGVFGIVCAFFRERLAAGSDLRRSTSLSGAIFAGAFLIPFLKYPAQPPSVGIRHPRRIDAAAIGQVDIEDQQIRCELAAHFDRSGRTPHRSNDGVALPLAAEHAADEITHEDVIIDNNDAERGSVWGG